MKIKNLLLIAFMVGLSVTIKAQKAKLGVEKGDFNIALNVGYLTPYSFDPDFANSGVPFGLGIGYSVSKRLVLGIEFGIFNLTTKDYHVAAEYDYQGNLIQPSFAYNVSVTDVFFMGNMQFHWLDKEKISLYSGLGIGSQSGTVVINYADSRTHGQVTYDSFSGAAFQFTAIGVKSFFGNHFGSHFELGYGIKGIVGGGIDVKF